jgi:hypothetical protein
MDQCFDAVIAFGRGWCAALHVVSAEMSSLLMQRYQKSAQSVNLSYGLHGLSVTNITNVGLENCYNIVVGQKHDLLNERPR